METEKITLNVSPQTVAAYRAADPEDRARIERVVERALMSRERAVEELKRLLDDMSRTAQERGLTEEKLQDLLDEE